MANRGSAPVVVVAGLRIPARCFTSLSELLILRLVLYLPLSFRNAPMSVAPCMARAASAAAVAAVAAYVVSTRWLSTYLASGRREPAGRQIISPPPTYAARSALYGRVRENAFSFFFASFIYIESNYQPASRKLCT